MRHINGQLPEKYGGSSTAVYENADGALLKALVNGFLPGMILYSFPRNTTAPFSLTSVSMTLTIRCWAKASFSTMWRREKLHTKRKWERFSPFPLLLSRYRKFQLSFPLLHDNCHIQWIFNLNILNLEVWEERARVGSHGEFAQQIRGWRVDGLLWQYALTIHPRLVTHFDCRRSRTGASPSAPCTEWCWPGWRWWRSFQWSSPQGRSIRGPLARRQG